MSTKACWLVWSMQCWKKKNRVKQLTSIELVEFEDWR